MRAGLGRSIRCPSFFIFRQRRRTRVAVTGRSFSVRLRVIPGGILMRLRQWSAVSLLAVAAVTITGCGADTARTAELGAPLSVPVDSSGSFDTDGTLDITVTSVETATVAEHNDEVGLPDEYASGTLFFVTFDATMAEGDYDAGDVYTLSDYKWAAQGVDKVEIATVRPGILSDDVIAGCDMFTRDDAEKLAAGETVTACQLFAATEADAAIDQIVYDAPMISRRGSAKGWRWNISE
ncbi:hypothetical protein [Microbacterium sp. YY-01]|uniref:hypothetical protein n=1 Tax=Microbacterium sp. YY-01 TaxID=3421634 RepID=UPI003D17CDC3